MRLINVDGHAKDFPRKKIDKLGDFVKTYQAKGLAWARLVDGKVTSSYQKFLTDEENAAILERAGAKDGDLVLIVGDAKDEVVFAALAPCASSAPSSWASWIPTTSSSCGSPSSPCSSGPRRKAGTRPCTTPSPPP